MSDSPVTQPDASDGATPNDAIADSPTQNDVADVVQQEAGPPPAQGKFEWLRTLPGTGTPNITTDAAGNTYVVGDFGGTNVDFGNGQTLSSVQSTDVFVAKLDPTGKTIWAKGFSSTGTNSDDSAFGVAVDKNGDVYFSGYTDGTAMTIGNALTFTYTGLVSFVGKLKGTDGTPLWGEGFSTQNGGLQMECKSLVAGASYIAIGCTFDGAKLAWSTGQLTNNDSTGFLADIAVIALDPTSHALLWANGMGSKGVTDAIGKMALDASGDVLVSGLSVGTTSFFVDTLASINVAHVGSGTDAVFTRLAASSGKQVWTKLFGGATDVLGLAAASDPTSSAAMIGGKFTGAIDFGTGTLTSRGNNDAFAVTFDEKSHTPTIAKQIGGTASGQYSSEQTWGVAYDAWGESVVVGLDQSPDCKADSTPIAGPPTANYNGLFAVKYSPQGTVLWAQGIASGSAADAVQAYGVSIIPDGHVRIVGTWQGTAALDGTNPISSSGNQVFVLGWTP